MDSVAGEIRGIVYHSRQWPHEFKGHDGGEDDEDLYRCNLITSMGYDGRCPPKGLAEALCLPTQAAAPSGKFFVSVLVEDENQVPDVVPETWERAVGGDLGLHDFLVLSTGTKYGHPQWLESELYRLKILQRRFAKTTKGSKNRTKVRQQILNCMNEWRTGDRIFSTN